MKTESTPSPWFVDGHNITAVIANEGSLTYPQWKHVCTCDYGHADPEKYFELNKANAKLIAQTPYMLELLKQCAATFEILRLQKVFMTDLKLKEEIDIFIKRLQ